MEENKVDSSAPGTGQPSPVDSQPMPEENVRAPFEDDAQSNDESVEKQLQELPQPEPATDETNAVQKGVQEVHVVDENPEDHLGAETADPWNNEKETDWTPQPSDRFSE